MSRTLVAILAAVMLLGAVGGGLLLRNHLQEGTDESIAAAHPVRVAPAKRAAGPDPGSPTRIGPTLTPPPAVVPAGDPSPTQLQVKLRKPPRAGILFDIDTGDVLWSLNPRLSVPIASLTKMMTGLLIAERHAPSEKVLISEKAAAVPGSATGVLPKGKQVPLGPLLQALLMISGNDAAVALAEHDAGSAPAFVTRMNRRAAELALGCTHFSTPNGLRDHGNYSCADDLATLARLDLANPVLSTITARHDASPAFPIKGGKLHLASNNPFILKRIPGVTGLKTGYTSKAGRCYVISQRHAGRHLGVVLLDSPDPLRQVPQLLKAGFDAPR
ncbi:MAG: D-alanyl-D-alanine carboxypeptidase family protein [Solirubrobacterales bacterium]